LKAKGRIWGGLLVCTALLGATLVRAQSIAEAKCSPAEFNPQPWLEDFAQLTAEMASHYADLEYAVEVRHMDLPGLRRETEAKLKASCSQDDAKRALRGFFTAFGDGHLDLQWPASSAQSAPEKSGSLCSQLGYKNWNVSPGVDFSALPEFSSIGGDGSGWFPGGILKISEHTKLGVLRIPAFSEHAFLDPCEQIVPSLHIADVDKCDQNCKNRVSHETGDLLTATVMQRVAQLEAAGATSLLIDVTHNDGGSNWVDPVVRSLSPKPLRESGWGFIKHEHWTRELNDRLAEIETDLKNGKQPRDLLQQAASTLRLAIARSEEKCDRSSVWIDGKLPCSLVVGDLLYSTGILPYTAPGSFDGLESKGVLFHPLDYRYTDSTVRVPLYVVVDAHTWSSAEYFAFMLQDNDAAIILGEVTGGAGCGFTNGGIPTTLKNSHAVVKMPDCVHFRKDGSNANAGVTPDVLVPWSSHDNSYLRAQKLARSLANLVATQSKEASHEAH
jgi:hypothetical protein